MILRKTIIWHRNDCTDDEIGENAMVAFPGVEKYTSERLPEAKEPVDPSQWDHDDPTPSAVPGLTRGHVRNLLDSIDNPKRYRKP